MTLLETEMYAALLAAQTALADATASAATGQIIPGDERRFRAAWAVVKNAVACANASEGRCRVCAQKLNVVGDICDRCEKKQLDYEDVVADARAERGAR